MIPTVNYSASSEAETDLSDIATAVLLRDSAHPLTTSKRHHSIFKSEACAIA